MLNSKLFFFIPAIALVSSFNCAKAQNNRPVQSTKNLVYSSKKTAPQLLDVQKQISSSVKQYKAMLADFDDTTYFPQSFNQDDTYSKRKSGWWCSGFFGGSLWYLYEFTKDPGLKMAAKKWTEALEEEQDNKSTHDLGFMLYCSYGNGYRLTAAENYKNVLLNGAKSLATRFNPNVGLIKSWDSFQGYKYPVIIDNMMNLEYLFWAAKESGNKAFYKICISHADSTLKNHFRKDFSSYHVVCYSPEGKVLAKKTAQGYSDESAWARGQAWGLYGYTVMYRETKNKKYLVQAENIARFIMNYPSLPADGIPYWDYNAPDIPYTVRDASAAAITASALLELSKYEKSNFNKVCFSFASKLLKSLSSPVYFAEKDNGHFLLKHCTGNLPSHSEVDVPLIYADYYYIEALMRYDALTRKKFN